MNKTLSLAICLLSAASATAQVVSVDSTREIALSHPIQKISLAPTGDFLLLSDYDNKGLSLLSLSDMREEVITDAAGAGWGTAVEPNGDILYRTVSYTPTRQVGLSRYSIKSKTSQVVVAEQRQAVQPAQAETGDKVVTNQDFQLELTRDGKTTLLSPFGTEQRYIWPSISPDGRHLLFFVSGDQAYISDINGQNPKPMGILRAAKWLNDTIIVGQRDEDDGEQTTASRIIVRNTLDGTEQQLSADDQIAMFPSVTSKGDRILYSTPEGRAFLLYVHTK